MDEFDLFDIIDLILQEIGISDEPCDEQEWLSNDTLGELCEKLLEKVDINEREKVNQG